MRMRSLMTQAPSRNPSSVLKRPLDQHHLGCINLGQSVLVPYQPSASSYATVQNCTFSFSTQTEDVNIECESYKSTSYSPHISR